MRQIDLGSEFLNYILASGFEPGDTLPTIKDLSSAEHLGISTSKVREQLEVARALGIVEVKSRTGMQLKTFNFAPPVRLAALYAMGQNPDSFEPFNDLRIGIEQSFWHQACYSMTDRSKAIMRDAIVQAQYKLNSHPIRIPFEEHRRFHLAMYTDLDNAFVLGLLEAYWDAYDAVAANHYAEYRYLQEVWRFHQQILDAICTGDFDQAQQHFIDHTRLRRYQPPSESTALHDLDGKEPENE
ncbi:FadR family transcriptional regulator [Phototrophicus methaneseepsis]|uniref:FadR family transcriptional regulator n=1 Tax=Phototrophicus methaneseepsis TaxID=2710758 RepID=A0A7S8ICR0_9CHLR|nr:FCD domain-containing protein [Phototrophicus methaneseepsis]QPC80564.1 FadR family transcriptional regulator [Phototrophicus methaneseepsis]